MKKFGIGIGIVGGLALVASAAFLLWGKKKPLLEPPRW